MDSELRRRALATREAYSSILQLKKLVDDAAQAAHAAELEAISMAIRPRGTADVCATVRAIRDRMKSVAFEATLSQVREKLETAAS